MKKLIFILCFFIFINVNAKVNVYLFYGDGCPHCTHFEEFVENNMEKYGFEVTKYEVWYNKGNKNLLNNVAQKFNDQKYGVPYIVVGNKRIIGWNETKTREFVDLVIKNKEYKYCDIVKEENCTKDTEGTLRIDNNEKKIIFSYLKKYISLVLNLFE